MSGLRFDPIQMRNAARQLVDIASDAPPDWAVSALCAQTDPELFFPDKGGGTGSAKRICARCEVRRDCLALAMRSEATTLREGIFGGLAPTERRALARTSWQPGDEPPAIRHPYAGRTDAA